MNTTNSTAYNYQGGRQFTLMTVVWGIVGLGLGVFIAAQWVWPELNFGLPWTRFGRLQPLHTNAVIFAFGGCALFASSYYTVRRTCQTRLFAPKLAALTFWGWQRVIVLAAITLPLGYTRSKEYAELEWPIDSLITIVWVAYAVVFFGTLKKRTTRHLYVGMKTNGPESTNGRRKWELSQTPRGSSVCDRNDSACILRDQVSHLAPLRLPTPDIRD
jgi:cytochrome c oxidase cbb3-type subunit I